jgi:predicted dehydrogenase
VSANAKLRVGLIGCGKVARLHASALRDSSFGTLAAACSRTLAHAQRFAAPYSLLAYDDVGRMVDDAGLDAVIVCTPHPAHAEPTIAALAAGAHVLVEKPMAASLQDCDRMIAAASEANRVLGVVSQRRFFAPTARVHAAIEAGRLGRPVLGTATMYGWRDAAYYASDPWRGSFEHEGGGVLVNQAPHLLDLMLWYMGEVDELFGYWSNFNHPYIDVEDTAVAVIRFRNGGIGQLTVSNSQNPALCAKISVHGDNGASVGVQTDGGQMFIAGVSEIAEAPFNDIWTVPGEADMLPAWQREDRALFARIDAATHYHRLQIDDFLSAVVQGRAPLVHAAAGRRTVELFTALYRSQQSHEPVRFPLARTGS